MLCFLPAAQESRTQQQAGKPGEPEAGDIEHPVERGGQVVHHRAGDAQSQVAPAAGDSIASLASCDIEAADKGHPVVANEQFPVVPEGNAAQGEWIKKGHLPPCGGHGGPVVGGQIHGAEGVKQDPDLHAALHGGQKRIMKVVTWIPILKDIRFQKDGMCCFADLREKGLIERVTGLIPLIWSVRHVYQQERSVDAAGIQAGKTGILIVMFKNIK